MLVAKNLTKIYKRGAEEILAVDDVSLTIQKGEFVSFIGPSGSGKTTLINILGCLDNATSGSLSIGGRDIFSAGHCLSESQLTRIRRVVFGYIFQKFYLVPTLNKLKYHYALAFGYVPGYGKFGLFNKWIVHWDLTVAIGLGMIRTEIIPRRFGDKAFTNDDIVGHGGLGVRLFVLDWLTLSLTFRDYVYQDAFEYQGRTADMTLADVKKNSQDHQSQLVQNIMMFFSIGLYVPPSFTYRTPR